MNDEKVCRQAYDDFYHKIKAEVGYDHWCAIWRFISKRQARGEPVGRQHPDDAAVDAFAAAMKGKLAKKRAEGRGGWQSCSADYLSELLREHVEKGDPVDVASLAMMLHQNGQSIQPAPQPQQIPEGYKLVPVEPPTNCRQRLAKEGKPYPRSSCFVCGQLSPRHRECDAMLKAAPEPKEKP